MKLFLHVCSYNETILILYSVILYKRKEKSQK